MQTVLISVVIAFFVVGVGIYRFISVKESSRNPLTQAVIYAAITFFSGVIIWTVLFG